MLSRVEWFGLVSGSQATKETTGWLRTRGAADLSGYTIREAVWCPLRLNLSR